MWFPPPCGLPSSASPPSLRSCRNACWFWLISYNKKDFGRNVNIYITLTKLLTKSRDRIDIPGASEGWTGRVEPAGAATTLGCSVPTRGSVETGAGLSRTPNSRRLLLLLQYVLLDERWLLLERRQ